MKRCILVDSSPPLFSGVRAARGFCRSYLVFLFFSFWPLCCLFFFDLRILITPLVSSNSSCPFVHFFGVIVLYVPIRFMGSDCHFGIFKLFLLFNLSHFRGVFITFNNLKLSGDRMGL